MKKKKVGAKQGMEGMKGEDTTTTTTTTTTTMISLRTIALNPNYTLLTCIQYVQVLAQVRDTQQASCD